MLKSKNLYKLIVINFLFFSITSFAQKADSNKYVRFIDSADAKIYDFPSIANDFLDSIPKPLENNIKGHVAKYYHFKAVISSFLSDDAEVYHYNILSLKYAEKEKNYEMAGASSIELFYNLYIIKKDSTALDYLEKAEKFYTLDNNEKGLIDVMQMRAFTEFNRKNYKKCNDLLIPKLTYYKSIKDDSFYYMYALFMLTSNYIHLDDDVNREKYFKEFRKLENDTTISTSLYKIHEVTLNICMQHLHLERNELDSALHFLNKVDKMRDFMNNSDKESHFKNYLDYFEKVNDATAKNNYIDSLKLHNENLIEKNLNASYNINKSFLETSNNLKIETEKKFLNRNWILFLTVSLIGSIVFIIVKQKKIRKKIEEFSKRKKEYTFLQNNHEKLKVKVKGLENYIAEIKKEVKTISSITTIDEQKKRIQELHKEIHHNSSVLLAKGESHLDLINELNVEFFNEISIKHPELNSSERIICYYLFMDFKSKEIAAFINTSVRSVESKRYRITNKLNLKEKDFKLSDYLKESFSSNTIDSNS
ncbi:hypothetical protein H9W90_09895 [Polaribacter pectinis]|uniref:HTH luxR-type domain-containing protein n=1 Tax=Polaribacter pectinis TaxID=2738844 RepID=A0A7G9L7A8_9FLAO|nr:hypothetical protein [Polaribacter pectinis]QNM84507.1 hypothetical protein H9W90_09895 [Polaribacter pectinis]